MPYGYSLVKVIVCKNKKWVPIIVPKETDEIIKILMDNCEYSPNKENPYVFGTSATGCESGNKAMAKCRNEIHKNRPFKKVKLLTQGKMRKLFSLELEDLKLNHKESRLVNNYLGHNDLTHQKHYLVMQKQDFLKLMPSLLENFRKYTEHVKP